jgi:glycerate dehydrogenase
MRGVILDAGTLGVDVSLAGLQQTIADWGVYDATTRDQTMTRIADADVVLTNKVELGREHFAANPSLKMVSVLATGVNCVDLDAACEHGVVVSNVEDYATDSVAEHTWSLVLALARQLPTYQQGVQQGRWAESPFFCWHGAPIIQLAGKTMVIVGYGNLGKAVAARAQAFGMKVEVAGYRSTPEHQQRRSLDELLPLADVVSLHCPLTSETDNLLSARRLELMKPSAILLNTARGGLVDESQLLAVLRKGALHGAALDVLTEEPPARQNPLLAQTGLNLIVTPHVAWASPEARQCLVDETAENIKAFLAGTPRSNLAEKDAD